MRFQNQTIFITGACGNLGQAVAAAFRAEGANLVLADLRAADLERVFGAPGTQSLPLALDLRDAGSVKAAADAAVARFGRIDVLCNLAGGFRMGPAVHETPMADFDFLYDLNVRSVLHTAAAIVPHMLKAGSGRVVNVGALGALQGGAQKGAYIAAKGAVHRLTESMAAELRGQGGGVNAVLPSILDTPQNRADMPDADVSRWVSTAALADVTVFLASDAARAVHGALVPVSGLS